MSDEPRDDRPCRHILIADDNVDAAQSLALLCRFWGHFVRVANDGLEAMAIGERFKPAIAILDINMPGLNGYEVACRLRKKYGRSITLIALTATTDQHRTHAAGFDRHFVKPADLSELRTATFE
jgi:CheY-like chemotaxis protein